MAETLVTLRTFLWLVEADQASAALRGYGIESFLGDQYFVFWLPLHALALGGVKLRVRQSEALDAKHILECVYERTAVHCPSCRSGNVTIRTWSGWRLLLLLLAGAFVVPLVGVILFGGTIVGMPLAFRAKRYHCKGCGFRWKLGNREAEAASEIEAGETSNS